MSSMRIVLVDPLGDVLFSGESWLARGSESAVASANSDARDTDTEVDDDTDDDDAEPERPAGCPQTLRSGESGIFPVEHAASGQATKRERAA